MRFAIISYNDYRTSQEYISMVLKQILIPAKKSFRARYIYTFSLTLKLNIQTIFIWEIRSNVLNSFF